MSPFAISKREKRSSILLTLNFNIHISQSTPLQQINSLIFLRNSFERDRSTVEECCTKLILSKKNLYMIF